MNPWSDADGLERELFERRARALPVPPLPPLAAVLRAADAGRERSMPRARVASGLALAAACFAATVTALPRPAHVTKDLRLTTPEADGGAPAPASLIGGFTSAAEVACTDDSASGTCSADLRYASVDVGACVAPMATFSAYVPESAGPLTCECEAACSVAQR